MACRLAFFGSLGIRVERVMTNNRSCYRNRELNELSVSEGVSHLCTRS